MFTSHDAKKVILAHDWEDGKAISVVQAPYRFEAVVQCTSLPRPAFAQAEFANGLKSYFCWTKLLRPDGTWIKDGAVIVPVLADGRILTVIEQRPAQWQFGEKNPNHMLMVNKGELDIRKFGQHSSPELPGGARDPQDKTVKLAGLRELWEETRIPPQDATLYACTRPWYAQGSDLALQEYVSVVFLSQSSFESYVKNDGGLKVLALTPDEVERNIRRGVICSGQAGVLPWFFAQQVFRARQDPVYQQELLKDGYMTIEEVQIKP